MGSAAPTIVYRAETSRFIVFSPLCVLFTALLVVLVYSNLIDRDWVQAALTVGGLGLFVFLDYVLLTKALWPPEVKISVDGFSYVNRGLRIGGWYGWNDLDGPAQTAGGGGVPLVQMTIRSSGKKLKFPPSHFGVSYDEMAAAITEAQEGRIIDIAQWRGSHPNFRLPGWLAPALFVVGIVGGLAWAFGFLDPYIP